MHFSTVFFVGYSDFLIPQKRGTKKAALWRITAHTGFLHSDQGDF